MQFTENIQAIIIIVRHERKSVLFHRRCYLLSCPAVHTAIVMGGGGAKGCSRFSTPVGDTSQAALADSSSSILVYCF